MLSASRRGEYVHRDSELNIRQVWRLWSVFAEAYSAEAREIAVPHRSFSLPRFLSVLIDNR